MCCGRSLRFRSSLLLELAVIVVVVVVASDVVGAVEAAFLGGSPLVLFKLRGRYLPLRFTTDFQVSRCCKMRCVRRRKIEREINQISRAPVSGSENQRKTVSQNT